MNDEYILDVGMNNGDDTDYYLTKGFCVIAVEANSYLCKIARARFSKAIESKRLIILNAAVSDEIGTCPFYINKDNSHWSSLDISWAQRNNTRVELNVIDCINMGTILTRYGTPHYIKIDIEGADKIALNQIMQSGYTPRYISVEDCYLGYEYIKILADSGFKKFKLSNQANVISSLDVDINYEFKAGSSGPFGEDLSGFWRSKEEFLEFYSKNVRSAETLQRIAPPNVWWDIHCSL